MTTAGSIAAIVAAIAGVLGLALTLRARRAHIEVYWPSPGDAGGGKRSYRLEISNVGSVTVDVRVKFLVGGAELANIGPIAVAPSLHRGANAILGADHVQRIDAGAPLTARVLFGLRRSFEVGFGQRKTV